MMFRRLFAVELVAAAFAEVSRMAKEADISTHDSEASSWVLGDKLAAEHPVSLTVAILVDDDRHAELERLFWEVSNPKHANYGKYLSRDEVGELLAVPTERLERVRNFFASHGVKNMTLNPHQDTLTLSAPASALESALDTSLHFFTHEDRSDVRIIRASRGYSLPADVSSDVVMVGELLQFPQLRSTHLRGLGGSGQWANTCQSRTCNGLVTPGVLSARYGFPNETKPEDVVTGNSMAVAEFQGEYYKTADLDAFASGCGVPDAEVDTLIGENDGSAGIESLLDIEFIKAVAPSVPLTVVYNSQYSLLDWANQILSLENPPLVHSVSYGNDEKQQSSVEYMFTANTAFMKAGVQGISILFASGDQGVCGRSGCGGLFRKKRFSPDFPAASPYITAVGGTDFLGAGVGDEKAWQSGGGGFSDTFDIPAYQAEAVAAYKARQDANLPPQAYWNNTGRGYPDVAALGGEKTPYCVAVGTSSWEGVAGTSASSPVVAGVFARLNGLRLKAGKPALGFLNPFIYQNPSAFQDVKAGINKDSQKYGFTAVEGWDAATGFGTPDYDALAQAAMDSVHDIVV